MYHSKPRASRMVASLLLAFILTLSLLSPLGGVAQAADSYPASDSEGTGIADWGENGLTEVDIDRSGNIELSYLDQSDAPMSGQGFAAYKIGDVSVDGGTTFTVDGESLQGKSYGELNALAISKAESLSGTPFTYATTNDSGVATLSGLEAGVWLIVPTGTNVGSYVPRPMITTMPRWYEVTETEGGKQSGWSFNQMGRVKYDMPTGGLRITKYIRAENESLVHDSTVSFGGSNVTGGEDAVYEVSFMNKSMVDNTYVCWAWISTFDRNATDKPKTQIADAKLYYDMECTNPVATDASGLYMFDIAFGENTGKLYAKATVPVIEHQIKAQLRSACIPYVDYITLEDIHDTNEIEGIGGGTKTQSSDCFVGSSGFSLFRSRARETTVVESDALTETFNFTVQLSYANGNAVSNWPVTLNYSSREEPSSTDSAGRVSVTLGDGESVTIGGIPGNASYKVVEDNPGSYTPSFSGTDTGTVGANSTAQVICENKAEKAARLEIHKTLAADVNSSEYYQDYAFSLVFKAGQNGFEDTKSHNYFKWAPDEDNGGTSTIIAQGTIKSGDTFTLKPGEYMQIGQVTGGTWFECTEIDSGELAPDEPTKSGTITVDSTGRYTVTFVNGQPGGPALPETGGLGTTLFYVIGIISIMAAAVWLARKESYNKF